MKLKFLEKLIGILIPILKVNSAHYLIGTELVVLELHNDVVRVVNKTKKQLHYEPFDYFIVSKASIHCKSLLSKMEKS